MKHLICVSIAVACLAGAALAQDVQYNFDPTADFSKYRTYRWEKHSESLDVDDLTMGQLARGFDAELATKGLTRKDSGPTELVIVFQLAMSQEKELNAYTRAVTATVPTGGARRLK